MTVSYTLMIAKASLSVTIAAIVLLKVARKRRLNDIEPGEAVSIFAAFLLLLTAVWPMLQDSLNSRVNGFKLVANYVEALLQTSLVVLLQLLAYKLSMDKTVSYDATVTVSLQRKCDASLQRSFYVSEAAETLLQSSIIGLIPFTQVDNFFVVDVLVAVTMLFGIFFIAKAYFTSKKLKSSSRLLLLLLLGTMAFCVETFAQAVQEAFYVFIDAVMPFAAYLLLQTYYISSFAVAILLAFAMISLLRKAI